MKKFNFLVISAILISSSVFAQTTVAPVKTVALSQNANVKATMRPSNRKIIDPNVGVFRAPIPPANEHYKETPANKPTAPALTSTAPVKASTPLPVITSSQAKMTRAMSTPASGKAAPDLKTVQPKVAAKTIPARYSGKKITGVKPAPNITKSSAIKSKPKTLKPVAKKPNSKQKMFSSIYHR
jgi:hypothetical protein